MSTRSSASISSKTRFSKGPPGYGYNGERFELIARAGEPVRYQPGDVVECLSWDGVSFKPGNRYTVLDTSPWSAFIGKSGRGHAVINIDDKRFKLIHRPAKSEPLVFTPPEPQAGDRVRVTFEAKVKKADSSQTNLLLDGGVFSTPFSAKEMAAAKIEVIERAEKPLAVGDEVAFRTTPPLGVIRAIGEGKAWIKMRGGPYTTERLEDLIRVQSL